MFTESGRSSTTIAEQIDHRRAEDLAEPVELERLRAYLDSQLAGLAGVVTELGGLVSHATIVARENGLPAVVGVPEATRRVRDGQRVRVDGSTGIVEVLE